MKPKNIIFCFLLKAILLVSIPGAFTTIAQVTNPHEVLNTPDIAYLTGSETIETEPVRKPFLNKIEKIWSESSSDVPYNAVILNQVVVAKEPDNYDAWPGIAKLPDGRLVVVYSGDRDWHVCPWGKMRMVFSDDSGMSWSDMQTIVNTPLDDRDAGILLTSQNTILVCWFTSLEFENEKSSLYESYYSQYAKHSSKISNETRKQWTDDSGRWGHWVRRSEDFGKTWGEPIRVPFTTPHGPIQLRDGRVLMVTNKGVAESLDDGKTWEKIADFPREQFGGLSEVSAVELKCGKILALSRAPYLRQFESHDGGYTWSAPVETEMYGYPPHVIQLENGWLLAAYGRRLATPMGQFASISRDKGKTWDVENEITIAIADKHKGTEEELGYPVSWDLGYPSSVILDDGSIFTVYYQVHEDGEWPSIMGTHWKLEIIEVVTE